MDQEKIIEITTIEQIMEISALGAGAVQGGVDAKKEDEMTEDEKVLREHIRKKILLMIRWIVGTKD